MTELIQLSDIPDCGHSNLVQREDQRKWYWVEIPGNLMLGGISVCFFTAALMGLVAGGFSFWVTATLLFVLLVGGAGTAHFLSEAVVSIGGLIDTRDPVKCLPAGSTLEEAAFEGATFEAAKEVNRTIGEAREVIDACDEGNLKPPPEFAEYCREIERRKTRVLRAIDRLKKH